ncbi:MAG: hypothetical protein EOP89_16900, partial [Lysobacteraceae bacterium]
MRPIFALLTAAATTALAMPAMAAAPPAVHGYGSLAISGQGDKIASVDTSGGSQQGEDGAHQD